MRRLVLVCLLATVAFVACLVVSLGGFSVGRETKSVPAQSPAASPGYLTQRPTIPRRATIDILLRRNDHSIQKIETYQVVVGVDDHLLAHLRAGGELRMFNRSFSWANDIITIDQPQQSPTATITVHPSGVPAQFEPGDLYLVGPLIVESAAVAKTHITISVEDGEQLEIARIEGPRPFSQSSTRVTFDDAYGPINAWLRSPPPQDATPKPVVMTESGAVSELCWFAVMIVPWLIALLAGRKATHRLRKALLALGFGGMATIVVVGGLATVPIRIGPVGPAADFAFALVAVAVPFAAAGWLRHRSAAPAWSPWHLLGLAGLGVFILVAAFDASSIAVEDWHADPASSGAQQIREVLIARPWVILVSAIVCGMCAGLAAAVARARANVLPAFAIAGFATCAAIVGLRLLPATHYSWEPVARTLSTLLLGLIWAPVWVAGAGMLRYRSVVMQRVAKGLALLASGLLLFPVALLFMRPEWASASPYSWMDVVSMGENKIILANLTLAAGLITLILRMKTPDPAARLLVLALVAIPVELGGFGPSHMLSVAMTVLAFAWLVPPAKYARAARLFSVSPKVHSRLIFAESWRRLTSTAGQQHFRSARQAVAEHPDDAGQLRIAQLKLDRIAGLLAARRASGIYLPEAALGSAAGQSAPANAVSAVMTGLALALPLAVYEFGAGMTRNWYFTTPSDWLWTIVPAVRWGAYALLFGYLYPWLRGRAPVQKALALLGAVAVAELARLVAGFEVFDPREFALAAAVRMGQATVFCLGLGLLWERRLVRLSGLAWARIRDFRSMQSLGAPVTTVVVAVLTAVATALAGAAVAAMLVPSPADGAQTNPSPTVSGRR